MCCWWCRLRANRVGLRLDSLLSLLVVEATGCNLQCKRQRQTSSCPTRRDSSCTTEGRPQRFVPTQKVVNSFAPVLMRNCAYHALSFFFSGEKANEARQVQQRLSRHLFSFLWDCPIGARLSALLFEYELTAVELYINVCM